MGSSCSKDNCCCSKDNEGAWCACVLCKRQCGTTGCCQPDTDGKDKRGQCCATVCCGIQCNVGLCMHCLGMALGGALCTASKAVQAAGVAAGSAAGDAAGVAAGELSDKLCGCDDCGVGACLLCLMPWRMACQYADNAARIDGDSTPYCVDCCTYGVTMLLPPCGCCLVSGTKRSVLRAALGLPRNDCNDKLKHFFCPACTLAQEKRLLDKHNFTHSNPAVKYRSGVAAQGDAAPVGQRIEGRAGGAGEEFDKL